MRDRFRLFPRYDDGKSGHPASGEVAVSSHDRDELLYRLVAACDARPVPQLTSVAPDPFDHEACVASLSCLWDDVDVPNVTFDSVWIRAALVWLPDEVFRYAFLRLMAAGLGDTDSTATEAVVETAAQPVASEATQPPDRFAAFSQADIELVSDIIDFFVSATDLDDLFPSSRRVYRRAQRNWKLFASQRSDPN